MRPAAVFMGHGSPFQLKQGAAGRETIESLGASIGKPDAILCVSAHWETARPAVSTAKQPKTIHDFYGFPKAYYDIAYPAPGAPDLARATASLLEGSGLACDLDPGQGLDHGAWIPLMLMYPGADVPVAQLSIQPHLGSAHHFELGGALRPLRDQGVLVLCCGSLTHNQQAFATWLERGERAHNSPDPWATAFVDWIEAAAIEGRLDDLVDYRERAPFAGNAHPRDEHFLPLLVAAGAGGKDARATKLAGGFIYGSLSMAAYAFDDADSALRQIGPAEAVGQSASRK